MKKSIFLIPLLLALLVSCSEDDERPANYFEINGTKYDLAEGYIDDDGTDNEITYRSYCILLCDKKDSPSNYFYFETMSNSTQRLEEGVYSYSYLYDKGFFSSPAIAYNLEYDEGGEAIKGTRIREFDMNDIDGIITIEQEDGDYRFMFNIHFEYNSQTYTIKGQYWDVLTNSYLYNY